MNSILRSGNVGECRISNLLNVCWKDATFLLLARKSSDTCIMHWLCSSKDIVPCDELHSCYDPPIQACKRLSLPAIQSHIPLAIVRPLELKIQILWPWKCCFMAPISIYVKILQCINLIQLCFFIPFPSVTVFLFCLAIYFLFSKVHAFMNFMHISWLL